MNKLHRFVALAWIGAAGTAAGDIINVPGDFPGIQGAINVAANFGDEIVVAPGTYVEQINFLGKKVKIRSSDGPLVTIIDADLGVFPFEEGSVVTCWENLLRQTNREVGNWVRIVCLFWSRLLPI